MVVVFALLMLTAKYLDVAPVETLRLKIFDFYQKIDPRTETTESIVLVEVTEEDLKKYGQWPWPRDVIANLHKKINSHEPKLIQYNIIFSEPDRLNELKQLKGLPSNDKELAMAISESSTILMYSVKNDPTSTPVAKAGIRLQGGKVDHLVYNFEGLVSNVTEILQYAKGAGVNIMVPNIDGTIRQIPLFINTRDLGLIPNIITDTLRALAQSKMIKISSNEKGIKNISVSSDEVVITDEHSNININYAPRDTIKTYSAGDLLEDNTIDIKNKIVIVGLNAAGLAYLKDTPLGLMTDAQISAQALDTVLTKTQLHRNITTQHIEISAVILTAILLIVAIPKIGITSTVVAFMSLVGTLIWASWHAYTRHNYLFDVSFLVIFITIIWGHLIYNNFSTQFRLRQQIKKQFEHYLDPGMVKKLQKDPSLLKLGGETRNMTFLFCDIRGFTPISEKYKGNPEGLTKLINRFLTRMTDVIIANGGTIDKFMGDCIMAFWNAPIEDGEHEEHAVQAAMDMQEELSKLNQQLDAEGLPTIAIGIGINTGEALVGNMGSEQRFDYSVIGDAVNLAARLESSSKTLGKTLVIGEDTVKAAKLSYNFEYIDQITVKGKTESVKVYTTKN